MLANNPNVGPYIMEGSNACTYHVAWNAFICLDQLDTIGLITFSSTKWNRFIRNVSPVNVTRKVAHGSTGTGQVFPWNLNAQSVWPNGMMNRLNQWRDLCWKGPYLCLERLLRIASLFKTQELTAGQQATGGEVVTEANMLYYRANFTGLPPKQSEWQIMSSAATGGAIMSINFPQPLKVDMYNYMNQKIN